MGLRTVIDTFADPPQASADVHASASLAALRRTQACEWQSRATRFSGAYSIGWFWLVATLRDGKQPAIKR